MNLSQTLTTKDQLIQYFHDRAKPKNHWHIGLEFEKFVFQLEELQRAPFAGPSGIESLLKRLQKFDWQPIFEKDHLIALKRKGSTITLEPGGQIELSTGQHSNLESLDRELQVFTAETQDVATELNLDFLAMGYDPLSALEDIPWMPKQRYSIMRHYMPTKGSLGLNMMKGTAAVQVALDYSSESDMVKKFRVALAVQPILTALLANSPFQKGSLNGYKTLRNHIWAHTDPDRCGLLPFAFENTMGFGSYVDYALNVPMYFIHRGDTYHDVSGYPFHLWLQGKLPGFEKIRPTVQDWEDHLTTLFPEVRLKGFLELRGVDAVDQLHALAIAAFWVGLLYDEANLNTVFDWISDWSYGEVAKALEDISRQGLTAHLQGRPMVSIAAEFLELAEAGLMRRAIGNITECGYLEPLKNILMSQKTPAQRAVNLYNACGGDMAKTLGLLMESQVLATAPNDIASRSR